MIENVAKDGSTRDHLAQTAGNGDPVREVCHTQDTLSMGTARVKQEEETDTSVIVIEQ